jgi:hypothetical protein
MADENKKEEIKEEEKSGKVEKKKKEKTAAKASKDDAPQVAEKPLDKMTVPELKEIARDIPGVTGATSMKKAELLKIVKEYRGIEDEGLVKKKKKSIQGKVVTVKDLKEKVVKLKGEKKEAREAQDRKRVDILRRRINRLKKQTRKVAQV